MGTRQTTLPLRRGSIAFASALWALVLASSASAQYPTSFSICLPSHTACNFPARGISTVCGLFFNFIGNVVWGPLQCAGPITVAVETLTPEDTRFPLYVEVVPQEDPNDQRVCVELPGYIVGIVHGHLYEPCGNWDEIGPIDITTVVPIGSLYTLRLRFIVGAGFSPALRCLRLTAHPANNTPAAPTTWGRVKELFQ